MDTMQVKDMLTKMGKDCLGLADRLREKDNRPINSEEKQLIRFSACPMVDELASEIKSAFLTGNAKWLDHSLEGLGNQVKSFMD